ncbi:MAG: phosphotransferase [Rhodobacterales bacterium]|nr:phosphotransferase [Rhodobacterales bacterium]
MTDAPVQTAPTLEGTIWAEWRAVPLAGDASSRRYLRLFGPGGDTAILMITDAAAPAETAAFIRIAHHLRGIGLCPPDILHAAPAAGVLVIEDLGPQHFAQWLSTAPGDAATLYRAAVAVLGVLRAHPAPTGLIALTPAHAAAMIAPLAAHYAPDLSAGWAEDLQRSLEEALACHAPDAATLALRDYHAENLIWRPTRAGTDRIGLLDFQDAVLAPAVYDLVSLLRDARRDLPETLVAEMTDHFCALTGQDPAQTRAAFAVMGVQRNLRILGIFARLARQAGKPRYLDLLPRVWGHIATDLHHPALAPLRPLIARLPAPDASHLQRLRPA